MQRQRPIGKLGTRVEVTPGSFTRVSRLSRPETLAANKLLTQKRGIQGECFALMREIQTKLTPADRTPDWVSSFSRRVTLTGPRSWVHPW